VREKAREREQQHSLSLLLLYGESFLSVHFQNQNIITIAILEPNSASPEEKK